MVLQGPLAHEAHAGRLHGIDNQFRIVDRSQVIAKQGIRVPDFPEKFPICHDLGTSGDAHLVVVGIQVAELDLGVRGDLARLAVAAKIGDVDREAVDADRGSRG